MQTIGADEAIKQWDLSAELYAGYCSKYGDINREVLLTPLILDILGMVEGRSILDAGCGEGYLSRLMAERGANVTAVDYSERLLEIAKELTEDNTRINYRHANLENLEILSADSFDVIVSCVVLQDVPDYQTATKEMYRVLRSGGECILIITHPCFSSDAGWVKDASGKKLHWKIDNHFYESGFEIPMSSNSENNPIGFHRTLTSYYKTIINAGFKISDLIEPYPSQDKIEKHPEFVDDLRMCHFLIFRLIK